MTSRMSRRPLLAALLAGVATLAANGAARAEPARYALDPEHLTVAFLVEHIGYAKVLASFRKVSGGFSYDEASGTLSDVRIVVETASVDSGHAARDAHVRGKDFLDASRHPAMTFTARSARRQGERGYLIDGELELLGKRRPLTLQATLNKLARYPIGPPLMKPMVAGASVRGSLRRSDFGMTYGLPVIPDNIKLEIQVEGVRQ